MRCVGCEMKNVNLHIQFMLILSLLILLGCSDIKFAPTPGAPVVYSSGTLLTDEFSQNLMSKKIDILFVVDNSISMAEEQAKLGARISSFLSTLHDIDWQIGITTTDVSDGQHGVKGSLLPLSGSLGYILNEKTPNFVEVFKNTVVRLESINCTQNCPSGDEQPLKATLQALMKKDTDNKGFFRKGADIGLMVLSDEDEMSTGGALATPPEAILSVISALFGDEKRIYTYGMIIRPDDKACLDSNNNVGHYGTFVARLSQLTNGLVGSICDEDYGPTLGRLGENVRRLLDYVELRAIPNASRLKIEFAPAHQTQIRIEGRRIYFDVPPPKDTKILVEYEVL